MYVNINGNSIHYKKSGNGKVLIMIHGNGESLEIFNKSVEILKDRFTVYALDTAGHGKSYKVKQPHYENYAEDVYSFINELNIEKPILYGFSDGGIIGLIVAYKHPDLLSKLIISGVNINPGGLKRIVRLGIRIKYMLTHSPETEMMLKEPNILPDNLFKITVPTFITAGQFDVIYYKHIKFIADHIRESKLKVFKNHMHGSYIVNSDIIAKYILDVI